MRTTLIGLLAMAAAATAQPGLGPGPRMAGPGARFLGAEVGMPGRVVKNAPFSADIVTETTQVLPDGNRIKQSSTVRYARDSEGRTRREQSLQNLSGLAPNSNLPQVAFISDPVAGAAYALDLTQRSVRKSEFNPRAGRLAQGGDSTGAQPMGRFGRGPGGPPQDGGGRMQMRARSNQNVKTESLGRQTIEGVPADGTRTTVTIPAGTVGNEQPMQVVTESWYSPDLQTFVLRKRSDPRTGETVTRYTNVSRVEPSRMMFEPPADFKVMETRRGAQKQ